MKLLVKIVPLEIPIDEFAHAKIIDFVVFDTTDTSGLGQLMLTIGIGNEFEMDSDGPLGKRKFRLYSILRIPEVAK